MKSIRLLIAGSALLLSACSPHPGTGVWQANGDNEAGIVRLVVSFNGRAEFSSRHPLAADWHCFWSGLDKHRIELDCTPSTQPDQKQVFILYATVKGQARLQQQTKTIAAFHLLDEDPTLKQRQ